MKSNNNNNNNKETLKGTSDAFDLPTWGREVGRSKTEKPQYRHIGLKQIEQGLEALENRLIKEIELIQKYRFILLEIKERENVTISINDKNDLPPPGIKNLLEDDLNWVREKIYKGEDWKMFVKGRCLRIETETGQKIDRGDYIKYMEENLK